jgi:hypothetical protein
MNKSNMKRSLLRVVTGVVLVATLAATPVAWALGEKQFVRFGAGADAITLADQRGAAPLVVDPDDHAGVRRAVADLQQDIGRVTGKVPAVHGLAGRGQDLILVGTLGHSAVIDRLAREGRIDAGSLRGKWEGYLVQAVRDPMPGVARALVVAGSDKRGTIYGIYTLAEQIGVSPWSWWADVPPARHAVLAVADGTRVTDAPVVKYRGIFLNDEAPALSGWAREKFGGFNHRFYEKVFGLLLRMRGNYLWPAMWGNAFYTDDPQNGPLADEMGIVMGTSHHEPMMRAQQEWHNMQGKAWNYGTNAGQLKDFWRGGLQRTRTWDKVVTMGMRGDGDEPMSEDANVELLQQIVADQRTIITDVTGKPATQTPQLWALYKEVQDYYEKGMRVPDDMLLLWCDDNWGNIRRLPTAAERQRAGGAGIYYHFDYVGGPRSYKWINVTPLPKVWEQMHLAWRYGADRLWIVNVGDLKPMEVPTEFFLSYAWNPAAWPAERLPEYLVLWATREFGAEHAREIAGLVERYAQYNGRRRPEQLTPDTYSAVHYRESERVVADYQALAARAEALAGMLPQDRRDAFYQLVYYPVRAASVVNELYATVQRNRLHAAQGRADTNDLAAQARQLFALDAELVRRYHQDIAGGKWNRMMSQTHIGYTSWNEPKTNVMPEVREIRVPDKADMGVAIEGAAQAWPEAARLRLPAFDPYQQANRYIDIFNRGAQAFAYQAVADAPWITLSHSAGTVDKQQRLLVDVRWQDVPAHAKNASITVTGPAGARAVVEVTLQRTADPSVSGFIETGGVVAIEAEHHARAVAPAGRSWLRIPGHGHTLSGVTPLPVDAAPATLQDGMRLEYDVHLFQAGSVKVQATLAPTQKFRPGPGFRYAVSFDDQPPVVVDVHADGSLRQWEKTVSEGVTRLVSEHQIKQPGRHTLKFWALDPGLVLQRLVIDAGGLQPSYLGPPESPHLP